LRWIEKIVLLLDRTRLRSEAIAILDGMKPERLDARLHFIHGLLLESLPRDRQALAAYTRFMELGGSEHLPDVSELVEGYHARRAQLPSWTEGVRVPKGLYPATGAVSLRIMRLTLGFGSIRWDEACGVLPVLKVAAEEDWRQAIDFAGRPVGVFGKPDWWKFFRQRPGNPIGHLMLRQSGRLEVLEPDQVQKLLKMDPPLPPEFELAVRRMHPQDDTLEWLIRLDRDKWRDAALADSAIAYLNSLLKAAEKLENPWIIADRDIARAAIALEKAGFDGKRAAAVHFMRARIALMRDDPDDFLKHVARAMSAHDPREPGALETVPDGIFGYWRLSMGRWRQTKGDAAFNELVGRVPSPVLRCLFGMVGKWDKSTALIRNEINILPADAARPLRRDLIRLRWSMDLLDVGREKLMGEWKTLSNDDADPRLALEALFETDPPMRSGMDPPSPRMIDLWERLQKGNEADRRFAGQYTRQISLHDAWAPEPTEPKAGP
jgi:hypothetical protein